MYCGQQCPAHLHGSFSTFLWVDEACPALISMSTSKFVLITCYLLNKTEMVIKVTEWWALSENIRTLNGVLTCSLLWKMQEMKNFLSKIHNLITYVICFRRMKNFCRNYWVNSRMKVLRSRSGETWYSFSRSTVTSPRHYNRTEKNLFIKWVKASSSY